MATKPPVLQWIRPPQQARSQRTLDRILDAAQELVAEKGFDDAAVTEIVARANSSVGAFYTRFPDKDALFFALWDRYQEQTLATADAVLDPAHWREATLPEICRSLHGFIVSIYREHAGLLRAFITRSHTDAETRARREEIFGAITRKMLELLLSHSDEIGNRNPNRAAAFGLTQFFSTLDSVLLFGNERSADRQFSDEELVTESTAALLSYLEVDVRDDEA